VVLAALRYAFLKYKMGGDIIFDPKESVAMTGNSGVYLLYSTVRAKKVLQRVGNSASQSNDTVANSETSFVRKLSKKIVQYQDVLKEAVAEKAPNKICAYLFELAQEFSRFYENVKVIGNENEAELIVVVQAYTNVMEHGLGLLGIEVPEEM
jgi:arginyl-tRNA synthetase